MKLVVISHKPCWHQSDSPSGHVTDGGFPFQIGAISQLFDCTTVLVPVLPGAPPAGVGPLRGRNLQVEPLPALARGWLRKLYWLPWLLRACPTLWRCLRAADAVHAPIPGDLGMLGIALARLLRKPLFVRYCGRWGKVLRFSHRLAFWWLERIAGGSTVVLATGGGAAPPSLRNPHIRWIFATSLRASEIAGLPQRPRWQPGAPLHLISVARQEPNKRTDLLIEALALIRQQYPQITLQVVGDGSALSELQRLTAQRGLEAEVSFHGKLEHGRVLEQLSRCHLLCFPSESEGFPKAVHEAMACGLPVIASRVSVLPELIGDQAGVLLSERSAEAIAEVVLGLIASPERIGRLGATARARAAEYSLERWQEEIRDHLRAAWGPLGEHQRGTL